MCYILRGRVSVSLIYKTRQAHALCHVVTCDLSGSTIFFHIIAQTTRCSGKTIMNIQRVFYLQYNFSFLALRMIERDMNRTVYRSGCIERDMNRTVYRSGCIERDMNRTVYRSFRKVPFILVRS
jgi:hypothetical protein